jgi:predicted TIM-barrel enzyme
MGENREKILKRFRKKIREGKPIVGGGAGTGISAKFEEAGGIDLIIIYNSGRFRMAGHGSMAGLLPFGDANQIVMEMADEVLPVVKRTPVLAGVCGTDPMRIMEKFLAQVKDKGFAGIQNFPTVGLFDGRWRENLEETGFGYYKEVEMVAIARGLDLLTTPYVFNPEQSVQMTKAGADIIVAHMGTTTSGSVGAQTVPAMDECVKLIDEIVKAAKGVRKDVIALCHGGPIAERAIREQTEKFVRISRG